ncbi:MAG: DegT/DnrJ/EryC1/StrS family aminotransferase [Candidatus Baltobacteraceae bacterium]
MTVKRSVTDFAVAGGEPTFSKVIPVGQLYFPSWERYESAMRDIFNRRYYTNHGPLLEQLEARLEEFFGVRHAIAVTNATIGLIMIAKALFRDGKILVPGFTFVGTAQAISFAGLDPVFCDVDALTHHVTPESLDKALEADVRAILGVNLWGGAVDFGAIERYAKSKGIPVFYDSAHGIGSSIGDRRLGGFGLAEVFSFHATKVLGSTEGGCICTNDDDLAALLRNMRCGYGMGRIVEVPVTTNGRMSEAQAAIALMSLDDLDEHIARNQALAARYASALADIPGFELCDPTGVDFSNRQYLVCAVDADAFGLSRDGLARLLRAENIYARRYFFPGVHRSVPYATKYPQYLERLATTDILCSKLIQLPIGALVTEEDIDAIGAVIREASGHAQSLQRFLT